MSYNTDHLRTAGKITVYTTFIGVVVFAIVFIFNLGENQIKQADAQSSATTTVTVLNTPPVWTATTTEEFESSQTIPTDEGTQVSWVAVGTDSNAENYWLLICDSNATPTPNSGGAPSCTSGVQWAVSGTTTSGTQARAATTTLSAWSESNPWFAWICDNNSGTPRCNNTYTQGTNATNSSPFEVNHRPTFTAFSDPVVGNPGDSVTFYSTSTDNDVNGPGDQVFLTVCSVVGFSTTTNSCNGSGAVTLATSSAYVNDDASATFTIIIPTQDQNYNVFPYIIDTHGLEATGGEQGSPATLTVNNVAPTVLNTSISLVQPVTTDILLTSEAGETTGFTLSFETTDNNSCDSVIGVPLGDEVSDFDLSIYRSGVGSTTCTSSSGLNANNCYPSDVAPTAWNLLCTASSTTCSGSSDTNMTWNCTFPLWYIADPTEGTATQTPYSGQNWRAQVRGIDDDSAVGAFTESSSGVNVKPLLAFALNTLSIPYGSLEPGAKNEILTATTTISATGNVGLDKDVTGESMCSTYTNASPCLPSATSTIPEYEQVFATSSVAYTTAEGWGNTLSSTTPKEIELNVKKTIATTSIETASAYWGIRVPGSISFAGAYTGQNTFTAILGEASEWY
jgi:hypothetical protein